LLLLVAVETLSRPSFTFYFDGLIVRYRLDRFTGNNMTAGGDHGHELEGEFPFYSKPVQRQRWGDEQIHPHTNWGE
jgi:hypothetical protein